MTVFEILIILLAWRVCVKLLPDPPERPVEASPPTPIRPIPLLSAKANREMRKRAQAFAKSDFVKNYRG